MEKRSRDEVEDDDVNSPEVKKLKESLLENLEEESNSTDQQSNEDLATFMKTFEDEITNLPSNELGFLLEASDDELGLPPPVQGSKADREPVVVETDPGSEFWDEPGYDEFDRFGFDEPEGGGVFGGGNEDESYVALDGLFDHSDMVFGSGEVLLKPESETLPAQ